MIRMVYRDATNVQREAMVYGMDDFISEYSPTHGMPVKTGPDGRIDPSLVSAGSASILTISRTAKTAIEAGDAVRAFDNTSIMPATQDATVKEAMVFGIALGAGAANTQVEVAVMGIVVNQIYSIFPANTVLYLDVTGAISDERPTTGYLTAVGKSLGSGAIMVQIGLPTKLGV